MMERVAGFVQVTIRDGYNGNIFIVQKNNNENDGNNNNDTNNDNFCNRALEISIQTRKMKQNLKSFLEVCFLLIYNQFLVLNSYWDSI